MTNCYPRKLKREHIPVLVSLKNDATSLENDEKLDFDFNFELDNAHVLLTKPLCVYNQDHFVAGNLNRNLAQWNTLIEDSESDVLKWIKARVDINDFIQTFKGEFWGIHRLDNFRTPKIVSNS